MIDIKELFEKISKIDNFFEKQKLIKETNTDIFDRVELGEMTHDEAAVMSNKLWASFILTFHYPHETDSPYLKNELKNNSQPFNPDL